MKKYLKIIYVSFIFAIFFCFGYDDVKAYSSDDYININYDNEYILETLSTHSDFVNYINNNVISYLDSQPYEYIIFLGNESLSTDELFYAIVQKEDSSTNFMVRSFFYKNGYSNGFSIKPNNLSKRITVFNSTSFNNNEYENLNFPDYIESIDFTTTDTWKYQETTVGTVAMVNNDYYSNLNTDFANGYFTIYYRTNADLTITSSGVSKEFVPVTFNNSEKNYIGDKFLTFDDVMDLKPNLNLKKEFTHKYNNNTLKYIDLYFDNNDYGKTINFKLDIIDNSDYSLCNGTSSFVNGQSCIRPELIRTQMAFLEDYGNGLYKWTGGITLGDTIDYTIKSNDNGFTITGKINLDHDLNLFNYKKIRVSFNLGSAYNVTYSYSDNSTITSNNIDEYYSWMMLLEEQRLNRIDYNYTKYTILTTDYETFSSDILVEYVNTSKYLFVEYFDTELSTYLQNGNIISTPNYFSNRDIEKFTINIGTSNNRGVYLLNHLKNEELSTSKYYFYIPEDLYFSQTESLGNSIYIDNTGANNTNGVIAKPDDNYEDSSFANDFFNTFQNNDFGLSAVISSPLRFIQELNSNTCSTIDLTLPYVNKSLQLPCMTEIYEKNFGEVFHLYQIITTGFVAYWVSVRIYALVKNFKNPEDDKIEVMDL